jgi:hypothetical protein
MHLFAILSALLHSAAIYFSMEFIYALITLAAFAVPSFRHPESWPPLSNQPWRATSLADFWRRWHQFFRPIFVIYGGRPGYTLAGRPGALLGAFAASAALHYVCIFGIGRGSDARIALFFALQAAGVLGEEALGHATNAKVDGWIGCAWAALFLALTAPMLSDAWMLKGFTAGSHQIAWFA